MRARSAIDLEIDPDLMQGSDIVLPVIPANAETKTWVAKTYSYAHLAEARFISVGAFTTDRRQDSHYLHDAAKLPVFDEIEIPVPTVPANVGFLIVGESLLDGYTIVGEESYVGEDLDVADIDLREIWFGLNKVRFADVPVACELRRQVSAGTIANTAVLAAMGEDVAINPPVATVSLNDHGELELNLEVEK